MCSSALIWRGKVVEGRVPESEADMLVKVTMPKRQSIYIALSRNIALGAEIVMTNMAMMDELYSTFFC